MSKSFTRHALAVLALAFPIAVLADTTVTMSPGNKLNLDTSKIVAGAADISWNGTKLTPLREAGVFDLTSAGLTNAGASLYNSLTQAQLVAYADVISVSPVTPAANDVIVASTNGGNFAKILVLSISGTSITLEFNTFTGSSTTPPPTSGGPTISTIVNNYSALQPGLPSYGIAPASLFVIYGSGLSGSASALQSSAAPGLPLTLNQTSLSVTVNGTPTTPAIYYASPTQIDAVLPSTTPAGSGTITVTYNGTASSPASILVTKSAFGIDTLYGTGGGGIVATLGSSTILPTASASPGQTITIWGSGLGADTTNNDRTFPLKQDNLNNATVYIGGVKANVTYAGRSQYPGVDQIDVIVPSSLSGGCAISVVIVANGTDSNFGTLPVNAGGGICVDAVYGTNGTTLSETGSQGTVKGGTISLFQGTQPTRNNDASPAKPQAESFTTLEYAAASFESSTGASLIASSSFLSLGSCIVNLGGNVTGTLGTVNGLDAGASIGFSGGGISAQLTEPPTTVGSYDAQLTTPLIGGSAYTFTGPGGKDVGSFKVTITFPVPLNWTNESSISTVTESQGQLITWTGGAVGTFAYITGSSSTSPPAGVIPTSVSFVCIVSVSDQEFTVPSYVLEALPKGPGGSLAVFNEANPVNFTASGIDNGRATAGAFSSQNVTYQ